MARTDGPAYSGDAAAEGVTPADATGERSAENTPDGPVTEAQAAATPAEAQAAYDKRGADTEEAARKQAEQDSQARAEDPYGLIAREANPEVGGESFPNWNPK
jgi:hypothetical protein